MNIESTDKIGQIAAEHPLSTRIFARHGIDFCCGGGKPLQDVCSQKGLDPAAVLDEIRRELATSKDPEVRWDREPLPKLIDHILTTYHAPLKEELPRLETMARKVVEVHGSKQPEALPELLQVLVGLKTELEEHMMKEERVLFPMIASGQGTQTQGPVSVMEHEHESAGQALARLRELTDGFTVPEEACNTWRALWHGLHALEKAMHRHIHLENNILFPRALEGR